MSLKIVVLGLSITSSWGNGHATTYRALVRGLVRRGHDVLFLERDAPWYAENRDLPRPPFGATVLYGSLAELKAEHGRAVQDADLVLVGSYVPDGVVIAEWVLKTARGVTAFYDLDTPITLRMLEAADEEYVSRSLVPRWDLYLSFTGGPTLEVLEARWGARRARVLYCSVDPQVHVPVPLEPRWLLGYLGTYSADRQGSLEELLVGAARALPDERFTVAGPQYPAELAWPDNVDRIEHLAPAEHAAYYGAQAYTLNLTRRDMVAAGWSPSVRLFEAAACGVAIVSDPWAGLETLFTPGREILVARSQRELLELLLELPEAEREAIAARARAVALARHTAAHRALELEGYVAEVKDARAEVGDGRESAQRTG